MLDINFIRQNSQKVKKNLVNRGVDTKQVDVDKFLKLDEKRSKLLQEIDDLRARRNELAEKGKAKGGKPNVGVIREGRQLKEKIGKLEEDLRKVEADRQWIWDRIPNMVSEDTVVGKGEEDNVEVKAWIPGRGYLAKEKIGQSIEEMPEIPPHAKEKDFQALHHVDLGKALGIIDVEQSSKVSGSRFGYLKGDLVLMQYALFEFLFRKLLSEGFDPMVPPILVKKRALYGTSHFPEGRDQVYKLESEFVEEKNELYLVGSSEPPIFAYFMDRVLKEEELPKKVMAYTTCFRSEAGSWGKDVRGIKRVHQFDKLEMDVVTRKEDSAEMMEYMAGINEWLLQKLELPYRMVLKCTGDIGYNASHRQYDWEGWLPSQREFVELGSNTNALDYQARRINIKYVDEKGDKQFAHTVNDTGCAMGRMLIMILDNYQQKDGSVVIPEALRKWVGKDMIEVNG
jgi:seryl-tRNA synthetase